MRLWKRIKQPGVEGNGRVSSQVGEQVPFMQRPEWCRGAQCDHLDEAHSRSCGRKERGGLTSRKELGRTSV